ncbi:uncharacterized protein H6S33_008248 [Morchella sextelata]|uniref:uncharacterized protein n=1 Tax=Morchella sextelata TaxID=1174677 RepID=UPI001D046088|nr:uncharacterized protein H6S33_008248 [Morchella sextelata]KAH0603244.1 hypothetical protein H6S33_008248 [Morchella sextelata]
MAIRHPPNPRKTHTLITLDPATMPLPHPLLLQRRGLCGRVKCLRAAAGRHVLPPGDGSNEDELEWLEEEEMGGEECGGGERGGEVRGSAAGGECIGWALRIFPAGERRSKS